MALKSVVVSAQGIRTAVELRTEERLALRAGEKLLLPLGYRKEAADDNDPASQVIVDGEGHRYSVFLAEGSQVDVAQAQPIAAVNDSPISTAQGTVPAQTPVSPAADLPPPPAPVPGAAPYADKPVNPKSTGPAPSSSGGGSWQDFVLPVAAGLGGVGLLIALDNDDNKKNDDDGGNTGPNVAPQITSNGSGSGGAASVAENSTAVTKVTATDANGDTLTYAIAGGADQALFTINATTGALAFISAPNFESPADTGKNNLYEVVVSASDGKLSDTQTLTVTVTDVAGENFAPVISSDGGGATASLSIVENTTALTTVKATDQDADKITFAISGGEDSKYFVIDAATGVLKFAAAPDFESPVDVGSDGTYRVTVSASDGKGGSDTQDITVTVTDSKEGDIPNTAPGLSLPIADQIVAEDAAFKFVLPANTFVDPNAGDTLTLSAALAGGGALPSWLSFDAAKGTFSGTPLNGDVGSFDVKVTATDTKNGIAEDVFKITVTNVNDAPVLAIPFADQNAVGQIPFSLTFADNAFTDVDNANLTYTAGLTGGGALPAWLSFDAVTRTFSGTPANADAGPAFSVRITASDGALTAFDDFQVTVSKNQPAVITGTLTGAVIEAGVAGAGDPTATADLAVADPDGPVDAEGFQVVTDKATTFGTYSVTKDGVWTYNLDNANPTVNALKDGNFVKDFDSFVVKAVDGTFVTVKIDITGANDAPTITALDIQDGKFTFVAVDPDNGASLDSNHDGLTSITVNNGAPGTSQTVTPLAVAKFDNYEVVDEVAGATGRVDVLDLYIGTDNVGDTFVLDNEDADGINAIYGFDGADKLTGNSGVDYIFGGSGADTIDGKGGNDVIDSGPGADNITGGGGNDTIRGDGGNDTIFFIGDGKNTSQATNGSDEIFDFNGTGDLDEGDVIDLDDLFDSLDLFDGAVLLDRGQGSLYTIVDKGGGTFELFIDLDGTTGQGGEGFEYLLATVHCTVGTTLQSDDIREGLLL
jgi:VCBS repeat-containing protein